MEHRVVGRRPGHPQRRVDRAAHLRARTRVIHHQRVAHHVAMGFDADFGIRHAVVIHVIGEVIDAVGKLGNFRAHPAFGVVEQVPAMLAKRGAALLAHDLCQPACTELNAGNHGPHIAVVVARRAHVRQPELPDLDHVFAALLDLDRRHANAFVENFGRFRRKAAGHHAAYFRDVANRDREGHQLAVDKHRAEQRVLGRMQPAAIGIVVHQHVAGFDVGERDFLQAGANQQRQAADLRRTEFGGGEHFAGR